MWDIGAPTPQLYCSLVPYSGIDGKSGSTPVCWPVFGYLYFVMDGCWSHPLADEAVDVGLVLDLSL